MRRILIFMITIFLVSGFWFQVKAVSRYEAEKMDVLDGDFVTTEKDHIAFWTRGTIGFQANILGDAEVTIRAKEDHCGHTWAKLVLKTPIQIDTLRINSQDWMDYKIIIKGLVPGQWLISFINDAMDELEDRNLFVDYILIESNNNYLEKIENVGASLGETYFAVGQDSFWHIHLTWDPPDSFSNDTAKYRLYYGKRLWRDSLKVFLTDTIDLYDPQVRNYELKIPYSDSLFYGGWQYFFALTAIDTAGNESDLSDVATIENLFLGDINRDGEVNYKDLHYYIDAYQASINRKFQGLKLNKSYKVITLK